MTTAAQRRAHYCRLTGIVVLLLGLAAAGTIYWRGTQEMDYSSNVSTLGLNRSTERQMGLLYGKQGQLLEDFIQALKRPRTQAILIGAAAVMLAGGCFYFSRLMEHDSKHDRA